MISVAELVSKRIINTDQLFKHNAFRKPMCDTQYFDIQAFRIHKTENTQLLNKFIYYMELTNTYSQPISLNLRREFEKQ